LGARLPSAEYMMGCATELLT